jgi:hypothetical protein
MNLYSHSQCIRCTAAYDSVNISGSATVSDAAVHHAILPVPAIRHQTLPVVDGHA